jgi:hypothetical protein
MMGAAGLLSADYGPGPNQLVGGDRNSGYFGLMTTDKLVTPATLAQLVGLTAGTAFNGTAPWFKFIDNGKILYVASKPLRYGISQINLDQLSLRTGKEVTFLDRRFKVRCLSGGNANPSTASGGEWDRLMYRMSGNSPQGVVRFAAYDDAQLGINGSLNGRATYCQETDKNTNYPVIRGHGGITSYGGGNNIGSNASVFGWRPVLELIP